MTSSMGTRHGSRGRPVLAAIAVTAAASLLSACAGSGSSSSGSAASGAASPGVDVSAKTITLGGWQIASGPSAAYKAVHDGAVTFFDDLNAKGGVNGWKIKYDVPDDGSDPARALQAVRDQISSKKVFALVSGAGSPENATVTPYVDSAKFPYVSPNDNGDAYLGKGYETIFPVVPPYSSLVGMDAKYAVQTLGAKKIALLYENDAVGQPVLAKFPAAVKAAGGTVAATVPFDVTDVDYTPIGRQLAGASPDVVITVGAPAALVKTKVAATNAGLNATWFGPFYAADPAVVSLDPATMNGVYFDAFSDGFFQDTPAIQDYKDALAKYQPSLKPGGLSLLGWEGASTITAGLEIATKGGKAPTQKSLMAALETFDGKQVGPIPAITYKKGSHEGVSSGYVFQYKDGAFSRAGGPFKFTYFSGS